MEAGMEKIESVSFSVKIAWPRKEVDIEGKGVFGRGASAATEPVTDCRGSKFLGNSRSLEKVIWRACVQECRAFSNNSVELKQNLMSCLVVFVRHLFVAKLMKDW